MTNLPLLSMTIFLPLIGVVFILLMSNRQTDNAQNAFAVGLLTSFTTFSLACILLYQFDNSHTGFQFVEKYRWITSLNSSFYIGVDGISLLLFALSAFLTPLALLMGWGRIKLRARSYVICFLILETMMLGAFCALDTILFYVFFEGVLIPMFLIIGIWGGKRRIYASLKFFLYTLFGSLMMLIAIIAMNSQAETSEIPRLLNYTFTDQAQIWLWLAFFASFAIKMPMWPFHTWLPDAHVEAPTAGSVILAGILLKMGGYGFLRFSLPMFPVACLTFANFVFGLSIIAVIYTSLAAMVQTDMKKLIAYSSVAHMGFVTFGAFSTTLQGMQGAVFQMISHGIVSSALFMCVGVLYERHHSRLIADYGGLAKQMPYFAGVFMILTFASAGLPVTSGFIGEILVMISAFEIKGWMAALMGLGTIFSAAYGLNLYRNVMFGKFEKMELKKLLDLTFVEKIVFTPLIVLTLWLGIYPQPILKMTQPAIQLIIDKYHVEPETILTDTLMMPIISKETI